MRFDFPYHFERIDEDYIPYPLVKVQIRTVFGVKSFNLIMDSGADFLTLPKFMIHRLGLDENSMINSESQGVGEDVVKIKLGELSIKFCDRDIVVKCMFTDNNNTPLLLGKMGIFDVFNVFFDNDTNKTVFTLRKQHV